MLAKPLTLDRSSSLLQLKIQKSPTSEQVKGPSRAGSCDSNFQDSCPQGWLPHSTSLLPSEPEAGPGELRSPFYSWENKAPNLSCLRSSVEDLSFRHPLTTINGPLESSKTWTPWILKATLKNLDPMVSVVTLNLGHITTRTHPRKPPDS